jgi:hypothetical protein
MIIIKRYIKYVKAWQFLYRISRNMWSRHSVNLLTSPPPSFFNTWYINLFLHTIHDSGYRDLEVACWPLIPDFAGSNPAEAVGFSYGGEVKPSVPCRALRHVKESKSEVEAATFDKILGHFSSIVPPSAAGFASVALDAGVLLWRKLERSKSLVLLQVGGFTCRWQRHSVKPSCWECSTTVE